MTQVIVAWRRSTLSWLDRCASLRLGRGNLFDLIRLYAATQVMLCHGASHLGFKLPVLAATFFSLPGVPLFFSISGFLVGLSCLKSRGHWGVYAWHRALRTRLYLCSSYCTHLIAFGRGSFLLSLLVWPGSLLRRPCSSSSSFSVGNFSVGVINGSLWTIPVEIQFYLLFPFVVSWLSFLSKKRKFGLTIVSITAVWSFSYFVYQVLLNRSLLDPESYFVKLLNVSLLPYFFQFLLGFACLLPLAFWGRKIAMNSLLILAFVAGILALVLPQARPIFAPIAMASLPIGIGLIQVDLLRGFDLSYGIYVFHMPIANALLVSGVSKALLVPAYLLGVYSLACLSWLFVEKTALGLKSRVPFFLRTRVCG